MYEPFFGLQQRPFAPAPFTDRYFAARVMDAARQSLARCIERGSGAGLLSGPAGTGKTLLLRMLAEQFKDQFVVAALDNGHFSSRRDLLQAILFELGRPYRGLEEGELRLSLIDFLGNQTECRGGMLLLIDEAHTLPLKLLEEIRLITNVIRDGQPRVRLVLAGSPVLEERFASPKMEAFAQRLAARCYLESLNRAETAQFVKQQIVWVGGHAERIFSEDALDSIYRATDGIPRLINQLCDHALMLAIGNGKKQLNAAAIDNAWADLQQLPSPWNQDATPAAASAAPQSRVDIIEFGGLDDEPAVEHPPTIALEIVADWDDEQGPEISLAHVESQLKLMDQDIDFDLPADDQVESEEPREVAAASALENSGLSPFTEEFAEEEVVVEKYANFDINTFSAHQHVYSQEGRVLSAMLDNILSSSAQAQLAASPRLSLADSESEDNESEEIAPARKTSPPVTEKKAKPANPRETSGMPQSASAFYGEEFELEFGGIHASAETNSGALEWAVSHPTLADYDPVFPEDAETVAPVMVIPAPHNGNATRAAAVEPPRELVEAALEDLDLIIVDEDEPRITRQLSIPVAPLVRRQEYRQLFARLRRGS